MGWDVMRLHGINKCQCHSHSGGFHEMMAPDEIRWDYLTKPKGSTAHILLVIGLFESWGKQLVTVTNRLLGCDETCHDQSKGADGHSHAVHRRSWNLWAEKMVLSHILLVIGWDITSLLPRNGGWCDSHPVVMGPDDMTLPDGTKGQHLLTGCWL